MADKKRSSLNILREQSAEAARRWVDALFAGRVQRDAGARNKALILARAAFLLYALEWENFAGIAEWEWPYTLLYGGVVTGPETDLPWTVLFRRAQMVAEVEAPREVSP